MEPDELKRYLHHRKLCRDITAHIHPPYREMYPYGAKDMTALNPDLELPAASLAVNTKWSSLSLMVLVNS